MGRKRLSGPPWQQHAAEWKTLRRLLKHVHTIWRVAVLVLSYILGRAFAMLDSSHYDLLAKYDSTEPEFDPNELATIFEILNLKPVTFVEAKLQEYRALILQTMYEQGRVATELTGEYLSLDNQGLRIEAMRYLVDNIATIISPFMLDHLVGVVCYPCDTPLRYGSAEGPHREGCVVPAVAVSHLVRLNGVDAELVSATMAKEAAPADQAERVLVYVPALDRYFDPALPLEEQSLVDLLVRERAERKHILGPSLAGSGSDACPSTCMHVYTAAGNATPP